MWVDYEANSHFCSTTAHKSIFSAFVMDESHFWPYSLTCSSLYCFFRFSLRVLEPLFSFAQNVLRHNIGVPGELILLNFICRSWHILPYYGFFIVTCVCHTCFVLLMVLLYRIGSNATVKSRRKRNQQSWHRIDCSLTPKTWWHLMLIHQSQLWGMSWWRRNTN